MRALLVFCHPDPDSFGAHLRDVVAASLAARGAEVRQRDLYAMGFDPVMSCEERRGYHTEGVNEVPVAEELAHLKWCDTVIFVYPTWWFGPPAMLKGWLDRVFVPYATFLLPTADEPMRGQLSNIVRLVSITTCGASYWQSKFLCEPGRRMILRGLRFNCHPRCKTSYAALYKMDTATETARRRYADRVARLVARL